MILPRSPTSNPGLPGWLRPVLAALPLAWLVVGTATAQAANWQNNIDYGGGPAMSLYVPDNVDESPGVVMVLHYCGGNAGAAQPWFKSLSDQHGFVLIAPDVGAPNCWDASPGRSGEKAAIVQMVDYVIANHNVDPTRVFSAGASSGACMTNTLLASYPEVFAAGAVLAGVPVGYWTGGGECSVCNTNPPDRSPEEWGQIVRDAAPGHNGPRPRVQLWHGTSDEYLYFPNLAEEVDQWTNVLGLSMDNTTTDQVSGGWDRTSYADAQGKVMLETLVGQGKVHDLTQYNPWEEIVLFFGLDQDPVATTGAGGTSSMGGTAGMGGTGMGGSSMGGSSMGGAGGMTNTSTVATATSQGATTTDTTGGATMTAGTSNSTTTATTSGTTSTTASPTTTTGGPASSSGGMPANSESEGGCSCQIPRGSGPAGALSLLLLAGMAAVGRRLRH